MEVFGIVVSCIICLYEDHEKKSVILLAGDDYPFDDSVESGRMYTTAEDITFDIAVGISLRGDLIM